ncbi:MAG: extracellular solute-binding protein [Clostridiales bacterium]|jgi:ABC-type glycerol-3-phosphate transport system substrate-binding protein|nr:extracellular solute-binding protein [Clostridiales bacterium]MDR2752388.1 extracellular solute-binding protein [Clostridiales bacterium]
MMKKMLALVLAVIMLAGCSSATGGNAAAGPANADKKLVVYVHQTQQILGDELKDASGNTYRDPETAWLVKAGEKFTAETGIQLEFKAISSDGTEVTSLLQVNDPGIDLFTVGWTITTEEYQAYMEPIMTVAEANDLYGPDVASGMKAIGDTLYNVSIAKEYGEAITYNEEVIKAAGYDEIPGDLEGFNKMLAAIKANGVTPISLHRVENWPLGTVGDFSNYFSGETNTFNKIMRSDKPFSDTPLGKTLKQYVEWKSLGYFEQEQYADFGVAMDSVAYGRAGMMLFGSWVLQQVISRVPEGKDPGIVKFDAAPDFGKGRLVRVAPAQTWAINKASKNIAESKQFIDFLATNGEYLYKIGVIANHKNVKDAKTPEAFALIDSRVKAGTVKQLAPAPETPNTKNQEDILSDANLLSDNKWIGLPFDALDITKPDDWSAFDAQIERQNKDYVKYRDERGLSYIE